MTTINAEGLHYRQLNDLIHEALGRGETEITVDNVRGQRYIGAGLREGVRLILNGVPGNDLAAFMNGAEIMVNANAQDGVGNTMNAGRIYVRGDAGDLLGHSMRGGRIFVKGQVGYRAGVHCKAYADQLAIIVAGRTAGDYLGEYIAGGITVVLNGDDVDGSPVGGYAGTGMHGGAIFVRGQVQEHQIGAEVALTQPDDDDWRLLAELIEEHCAAFDLDPSKYSRGEFVKLYPFSARPYGKLYAY
ncbi:MAG TPA: hypothetical protein VM283_03945 [Armatimonadota bacterium]|nr:hypothetical protein [Armatimonadota bacterium]